LHKKTILRFKIKGVFTIINKKIRNIRASSSGFDYLRNNNFAKIAGFEIEFRKKISFLMTSNNILSPLQLGFNLRNYCFGNIVKSTKRSSALSYSTPFKNSLGLD